MFSLCLWLEMACLSQVILLGLASEGVNTVNFISYASVVANLQGFSDVHVGFTQREVQFDDRHSCVLPDDPTLFGGVS